MADLLFQVELKKGVAKKLASLLRQAGKKVPGKQEELNTCFAAICEQHGYQDPGSCQITVVGNLLVVEDYPSLEEILAAVGKEAPRD